MKGISSKRIALKLDVTGPENMRHAIASVHHLARNILQVGAVKGLIVLLSLYGTRVTFVSCQSDHGQDANTTTTITNKNQLHTQNLTRL